MAKGRKKGLEPQEELAEIMSRPVAELIVNAMVDEARARHRTKRAAAIEEANQEVADEVKERKGGGGEAAHRANLKRMKLENKRMKQVRAIATGRVPKDHNKGRRNGYAITSQDIRAANQKEVAQLEEQAKGPQTKESITKILTRMGAIKGVKREGKKRRVV